MPYKIYLKNGEKYTAKFIGSSNHKKFKKIYDEVISDYVKGNTYINIDYSSLDYAVVKAIYNVKKDLFYSFMDNESINKKL